MKIKKLSLKNPIKSWSKKKKRITSVIAIVLVVSVAGSVIYAQKNSVPQFSQAAVQTATVTTGNISNTIVGTGNLETDASNAITVPSGITIKKIQVESGDSVSKGDELASVDITSVLNAMQTVQEEIEELDEKINNCKDSDETETITTKISGTVKKIYAQKGDSVTECIAQNGAIMVIQVEGDTDETFEITASGGTVSKVHVSKNEKVSAGDIVYTIAKDEESAEYRQLIAQRKELTESLKRLTKMSQTGKIVADIDGTVGDINVVEGSKSTGSTTSTSNNASAGQMSYSTGSALVQTLSATTASSKAVSAVTLRTASNTEKSENTSVVSDDEKLKLKIVNTGNSSQTSLALEVPKTGNTPQSEIRVSEGGYEGKIVWTPANSTFEGGTTYSADITLYAAEGFAFGVDSITQVQTGIVSGTTVSEDGKILMFHITFPETEEEKIRQEETTKTQNDSSKTSGMLSDNSTTVENSGNKNTAGSNDFINTAGSTNGVRTGSSLVTTPTSTSTGDKSVSNEDTDSEISSYSNEVTAFTLASNDNMILSVSVDELDINSVSVGQEANITLDAIEDTTFTGTVTKVGNSASSSGSGVAKYTVKITVPKESQMKAGMNASATIVIENKENVLMIPVNALQERRDKVFVYTQQDSEGNLSGEIEVTTGLSDGDNVEITEGLSEGDKVYYQKTGNTSNQSGNKMFGDGGPGGGRGDMQDMPKDFNGRGGNGNMPAGGPGGN